jgi:putative AdoMet-dependent methyltransferase
MQQVGTDYSDVAEVERYEQRMGEFRDLPGEDAAILQALALPAGSRIVEIGTGTGHFARAAAHAGYCVTAIDVSEAMLRYVEERAKREGLQTIECRHAGFLTFTEEPAKFDAAVSVVALHHLPDVWKSLALQNIRRILKPGGEFFLGDVVFSSQDQDLRSQFDRFVNSMPESVRPGAIGHVGLEYSTLDWIMEGLLRRAGFKIERIATIGVSLVHYLCIAT